MTPLDLATVRAADFLPHVGQTFTVYAADDRALATDLVEVVDSAGPDGSARSFAVTFAATASSAPNPPVPQGIYRLVHADLGEFELFLVPNGPGPDGRARYEAVFT